MVPSPSDLGYSMQKNQLIIFKPNTTKSNMYPMTSNPAPSQSS